MRADTLHRIHGQALTLLLALDAQKLARVLRSEQNGFPSSTIGGFGGGTSDDTPTERAALAPDRAAEDLHRLNTLIPQLARLAVELGRLQSTWMAPPRRAQCAHCGDPTGSHQKSHCRWCASFNAEVGRLPNPEELATRAAGRNVRRKVA